MPRRRLAWAAWPDEELLKLRLKDLKVRVEGTWLADCLATLHDELKARDLRVRPHAWISNEWFSPENAPGIAIPFYLAHPRLMRLERKMIIDVEGGTRAECLKILRHEAGHVVQHCYRLQRRHRWRELFGPSSQRYPRYYRPNPASRNFVQHLRLWYAQSHPDEDFAETFAVWLKPRSNWRTQYAGWPALEKLQYVDTLMAEIAGLPPRLSNREEVDPLGRLGETLGEHYRKKRALYAFDRSTSYDQDLQRLFSADASERGARPAASFIRRNRVKIRRLVAKWSGESQLTLDTLLDDMTARCRELDLRVAGRERKLITEFSILLTANAMHLLFGPARRRWIAL
jgi:hypothetical protein